MSAEWYFNSRPSARGDEKGWGKKRAYSISIHAPPRGATISITLRFCERTQFQFTPLREGRQERRKPLSRRRQFQFTPLREGRLHSGICTDARINISIHAPPRGATDCMRRRGKPQHFNSRPSARGDRGLLPLPSPSSYFNSRPSARGDTIAELKRITSVPISIHAPPRGATRKKEKE